MDAILGSTLAGIAAMKNDDGENKKGEFWIEALSIVLILVIFFMVFLVTGCMTDHQWNGERKFSYCAMCFEYEEKANTSIKTQAPQDKNHAD